MVGFFFVGVSYVCTSHSTHGVFSPALVRSACIGWVMFGLVPGYIVTGFVHVVSVLAQFSVINWATLFFLINE
jgi:hypothetical protein